jgi:flavorubredoxin
MPSKVTEIAADTYRISTFHPDYGLQFNQFLIKDAEPFLMHTGFRRMFDSTLEGVRSIIDPAKLRWIGFSHFEADECGALNEWLHAAPRAQAVCSMVGAMVSVTDYADRAPRGLEDEEVLAIGRRRLRFLATPHVPHSWDAGVFFEETEQTLLCSDLFFQPGDPAALTVDVVTPASESIRASLEGPLAKDMPYTPYTDSTFQRLATLGPKVLAVMHGSSFRGAGARALRDLAGVVKECLG